MNVRIIGKYDSDELSNLTALTDFEETRTRQEFKDESDINTIIKLFGIGENPIENGKWITDVDIVNATSDFQSAMNILVEASGKFNNLPAQLRSRFDNDPAIFVQFCSNPDNKEEMIKLGLVDKPSVAKPSDTDRIVEAIVKGREQSSP